jgi:hypothetical protein
MWRSSGVMCRKEKRSTGCCHAGPAAAAFAAAFILLTLVSQAWAKPSLCDDPWTYRVGKVDSRFNMSYDDARDAVRQACAVWYKAYSCNLFSEDQKNGAITINFIYDERQQKVNEFRTLDASLESAKKNSRNLSSLLKQQTQELEQKKQDLANAWKGYADRYNTLDVKVRVMKMQPRLSEKDRQFLATEPPAMRALYRELEERGQDLRSEEKKLESLREAIRRQDEDVKKHGDLEKSLDEPMKVGVYAQVDRYRVINIYLCLNEKRLVRTIAHELGHALGLQHCTNPESIMYYMDASDNMEITRDDLEDLKKAFRGFD